MPRTFAAVYLRRMRTLIIGVAIGILGAGLWARAQVQPNAPRGGPSVEPPPQIISGADFGFRVDSVAADGTVSGRIVVHQNGKWVEVRLTGGVRRLDAR